MKGNDIALGRVPTVRTDGLGKPLKTSIFKE